MKKHFRALAVLCVIFFCTSLGAAKAATSVGNSPDYLAPSAAKTFVMLSKAVICFTGDTYGTGTQVTIPSGTVCQLVSTDFYAPADGRYYYSLYYNSLRYNVLMTDVQGDMMSDSALNNYITGTLWQQALYTSLKKELNLVGDVRVYALQLALSKLGYYSDTLDGNFGDNTVNAVKRFQKANGLTADGAAGVLTQPVLYKKALSSMGLSGSSTSIGTGTGSTAATTAATSSSAGKLKTTSSVNLRKSSSKTSARLAEVPKGISLNYSTVSQKSGVNWYKVEYNGLTGWLMGTYVSVSSTSTTSEGNTVIGSISITKPGTRVRTSANGTKSGTVLAKGTIVSQLAEPISAGGYGWYKIKTGSGLVGYVRDDCASPVTNTPSNNTGGSSGSTGSLTADTMFIKLNSPVTLFTTQTKPASGGTVAPTGSYLRLFDSTTYTSSGVTYCSVYYNNTKYNCVYSDISLSIMSSSALSDAVKAIWSGTLSASLKKSLGYTGDIRVYALQVALNQLGLYNGKMDGTFGNDTETAVRNYQRQNKLTIDGMCGSATWKSITGKVSSTSGGSSGDSQGVTVADFGKVNVVKKASWNYDDNSASMFPKSSYAMVMDVDTGKVFRIYRWSGGNHADCVPATTADTKIMCDIVGYPYNSSSPTSSQLSKIKQDGSANEVNYTWPDFKNSFGGSKNIGSAWDRRACLLNVNGTVYAVSIYGFPHGFTGTDSFSNSKFPNGSYFYTTNNYYGMMCIHFIGSKTHGGTTVDAKHQEAIEKAYSYAQKLWPSLCK